jgi:hypothetical protein
MWPLLLQLQDKFANTSVNVTTVGQDRSSHRKMTEGKWTTKREISSSTNYHPVDPSQHMPDSFLKIGNINVNG